MNMAGICDGGSARSRDRKGAVARVGNQSSRSLATAPFRSRLRDRGPLDGASWFRVVRVKVWAAVVLALCATLSGFEPPTTPWVDRIEPLGWTRGEVVSVTLVGKRLAGVSSVEFSSPAVEWVETTEQSATEITGRVRISGNAELGPYIVALAGSGGRSNARMFSVGQFPSLREVEPNDIPGDAHGIELRPQTLHGIMPTLPDVDYFELEARAGERWSFDLRSLEHGGFLENDLTLYDAKGHEVAFNDDRDEYLETPLLEYTFPNDGPHYLKLDQYRGPQRVNCSTNCGYMLRISQLPVVEAAFPLGASVGSEVTVSLRGRALEDVTAVWLTPARAAEHYRLTFPYTIPLRTRNVSGRIDGRIVATSDKAAEVAFRIPEDAAKGLWRVRLESPAGETDDINFEIADFEELTEVETDLPEGRVVLNGQLASDGEEDSFWLDARAGDPLNVAVLAVQLGLPYIDTVLELFDEDGKLVAEHDDLMSGQGTVIGNPDSHLIYTPEQDQRLRLVVRDRIARGGPSFVYRLRVTHERPGFRLLTDPENPIVERGKETALGVLLVREPGFEDSVEVWAEGLPVGMEASRGEFRADQFFGPSADGDNVIIPEVLLNIEASESIQPASYPIRIFGRDPTGRVVEAYSTLWIGPPRKRNDVRRPLREILVTVLEAKPLADTRGTARSTNVRGSP